jgi:hypothetical protein
MDAQVRGAELLLIMRVLIYLFEIWVLVDGNIYLKNCP